MSRALIEHQIDYFFSYQAPILFADEKSKSALSGLRTERLAQAVRLTDLRRETLGEDSLLRGRVVYPEKVQIDETLFSLG
jgi:diaminohydroxyphosphoribosylaminopyrimidine deaminase/5-amino-6-(5-phosphoribosylamino)uracil reductase